MRIRTSMPFHSFLLSRGTSFTIFDTAQRCKKEGKP